MKKFEKLEKFIGNYNSSETLKDIDVSAETFFKTPNNYNKKAILEHYTKVEMLLSDAYDKYRKNNPNISNLNKNYKSCKKIIHNIQSQKLKELKKANKQIAGFKSYRSLYKNLLYSKEMFLDSPDKLKTNSPKFDFLEKDDYRNYASRKKLSEQLDCDTVDFSKKIKNLTSEAEKSFKKAGKKLSDYLPPKMPFWREVLCFFGKKNFDDIRHNFNVTEYDGNGSKQSSDYYEYSNWIEKLKGDTKLNQMVIPGAHDAGTYGMKPKSSTDLPGKMAQTQTGNFMGMLRSGIRYFDWRMKKKGETFVFYHGIVTGSNVLEAINQIDKFLDSNNKEIIIISLVADDDCLKKFLKVNKVNKFFKKRVYKKNSNENIGTLTLDDIRKKGKNIIIINGSDAMKNYGFNGQITGKYNPKTRQCNNTNKMLSAEAYIANKAVQQATDSNDKKLSALSPIHTPGAKSVLSYLLGLKKGVHNVPVKEAHKNFANNMNKLEEKLKDSETGEVKWTNFVRYDNVNDENVKKVTERLIKENENLKK